MTHGPEWMSRWWWPQSRIRLSREVSPPSAQWVMWWAWVIIGGRVQWGSGSAADDERSPDGGGHQALLTTDIEHMGLGAQDRWDDLGVAAQAAYS